MDFRLNNQFGEKEGFVEIEEETALSAELDEDGNPLEEPAEEDEKEI